MSGEYLNYQLGISPAVGAFSDLKEAMASSEKTISQLHRDSGKPIRRQYRFPTELHVQEEWGYGFPVSDVPLNVYQMENGSIRTVTTTSTEVWFSGAFTYYLPKEVGFQRTLTELDRVYGIKPGVDTAWELIPFSFVADYFSNAGEVLSNLNSFSSDGLVMLYGYVMAKQVVTKRYTWIGRLRKDWGDWSTHIVSMESKRTTMQRKAANPFGFGVLDSDLSLRQLSILAALGINRR
jgi:hypothetical protein